jgi:Carboxypeptidase regulatory-like domain
VNREFTFHCLTPAGGGQNTVEAAMCGTGAWLVVFVTAVAQAQRPDPPRDAAPPPTGSAAISGQIIDKESGQPFPRAIVTLNMLDGARQLETVADAQGRYEFKGLAPGEYGVSAGPPELRSTHLRQAVGRDAPMDRFELPPRSGIQLKGSEVRGGVDLALARALAIEGRLFDPWDEPMAEVHITLQRVDGTHAGSGNIYSDDRGEFRLFGLAPGRYRVCANADGSSVSARADASRFVRTCYPASLTEADAADVVLGTDDLTGIEIRVQRVATYSVSGSVVDSSGASVDGVFIAAVPMENRNGSSGKATEGRFVVNGLIPGRYLLRASVGGPRNPSDKRPPERELEVGLVWVDVGGGDVSDVVVQLSKGRRLAGRVVFEGTPAPAPKQLRMVVHASDFGTMWRMIPGRPPFSPVNDDLRFELAELYRLPLTIQITGLPDGWVTKSVRYDGADITNVPTDFGAAEGTGRLEIVLTDRVATPLVRVTDDKGNPLTSFTVVLFSPDPARWKGALPIPPDRPSREGVVKLPATLPGEYLIAALGAADSRVLFGDRERLADLASVATRIRLSEGDDRTIDLTPVTLPARR